MDAHQLEVDLEDDVLNEFTNDFFSQVASDDGPGNAPSPEHLEVLHKCFGHKTFRPLQWKIISSIINFKQDNCAIMATGYGKSLCFQYPSAYVGGLTLVISPLISLMEDQVLSLKMSNIPACLLGTAQTKQRQIIEEILEDKYSIIYLTPEFCVGDNGQDLLRMMCSTLSITLIAIDEAHCVSSWGHDFRPSYRKLGMMKTLMPDVPILAVTATATPRVKDDIITVLNLRNSQVVYSGFDRPNLYFAVNFKGTSVFEDLKCLMVREGLSWRFSGPTIIYCITRKNTEEISTILSSCDIKCLPYHAGLPLSLRKETHEKFVKDKVQVIVATIAFGMGIDKPDIRNVIHYGCSGSVESYYQEVGRAGRDGRPSKCVTFYSTYDFQIYKKLQDLSRYNDKQKQRKDEMLNKMKDFLGSRECRRKFILSYFEDKNSSRNIPHPNCCDNCTRTKDTDIYEGLDENGMYDFTKDAQTFLSAVNTMDGKFGMGKYIKFLRGSRDIYEKYQKSELHGSGKHQSEEWWKAIGSLLQSEKYLAETKSSGRGRFSFFTYYVTEKGEEFCKKAERGTAKLVKVPAPDIFKLLKKKPHAKSQWLSVCSTSPVKPCSQLSTNQISLSTYSRPSTSQIPSTENADSRAQQAKLLRYLRNRRHELSIQHDCMPYMVASDAALMTMATQKPTNLSELRDIKAEGFTEAKLAKFGIEFLKVINDFCKIKKPQERKISIQDILIHSPIGKISMSAETSYALFKKGLSIEEIAKERNFAPSTIMGHLNDAMKIGYPIKLRDLGVTDEVRDTIINVINEVDDNPDLLVSKIKAACPEEISYVQVNCVVTYVKIRSHLKDLGIPYEEFEDFEYAQIREENSHSRSQKETDKACVGKQDISVLLDACTEFNDSDDDLLMAACDELEKSIHQSNEENVEQTEGDNSNVKDDDSDTTIILDDEDCVEGPPYKKSKNHESLIISSALDSPPRESAPVEFELKTIKSNVEISMIENKARQEESIPSELTLQSNVRTNKTKKKLPTWLSSKR